MNPAMVAMERCTHYSEGVVHHTRVERSLPGMVPHDHHSLAFNRLHFAQPDRRII